MRPRNGAPRVDKVRSERGAGWRDPLAWNAVVDDRQTPHEESRGWRRHGQNAMCRIDPPGTYWQWRRRPAIGADQGDQLCCRDDIDDRIDRANLVKCDRVHVEAVHFGFRLSQKLEDRDRMLLHIGVEA